MKLNCDLGESFGIWQMGLDDAVMPHIDMANTACGFHAGDANVMAKTLNLAKQYQVEIGAHPSYPDLNGFGRRSMQLSETELNNILHYQVAALDGMAQCQGLTLSYVKPHGALYNDMMADQRLRKNLMAAIAAYPKKLKLMLLAGNNNPALIAEAEQYSLELYFEAFADRRYTEQGKLMPRDQAGAVLDKTQTLAQAEQLIKHGCVTTASGQTLKLTADSLCVHGDNQEAIKVIQQLKQLCQSAQLP